ncbi:uncharacterized protein LOC141850651 [Brevipalpus obovatus]|uniref:uncharacterized protein LOC141850651 n=1 Tax=Brevipalpus obovatus TaxID=246614 RepID=UPI003D9E4CA4
MAYGGLRGAIAFFLSNLLSEKQPLTNEPLVGAHKLFLTTTLFIILFTVLILGTTTKPLVRMLGVKSQTETGVRGFIKLNMDAAFVVMQGIEILTSQRANIDIVRRISNATEAMKMKMKKIRRRSPLRFETRTTDTDQEKTIIKVDDKGSRKRHKLQIKSQFSERSESYEYPDLDKRISIYELLDSEGNLFFPKLEEDNLSTFRPRNWRIILHKVSREFCIPVEFRDIFSTNLQ